MSLECMEKMIVLRGSVAVFFVVVLGATTYLHNGSSGLWQYGADIGTAVRLFQPAPKCDRPFVQIGKSCYFFSGKHKSTDYYKVQYKGRFYSVPWKLHWLNAHFGCEALDRRAKPIDLETAEEMQAVADYMSAQGYRNSYNFWSSGHRSKMFQMAADGSTLDDFYWHFSQQPMNYTNWVAGKPIMSLEFPADFCVNLQLVDKEILMSTFACDSRLPYVCELGIVS